MNRTHTSRLVIASLIIAVLLVAAIGLPGGTSSSAGQATITHVLRPRPKSNPSVTGMPIAADGIVYSPRPHPRSHIEMLVNRP